jgi:hypothetical protein
MPNFNERTHSATKVNRMNELFKLIENSRDPLLQEVADDMCIRKTFGGGFDSMESEQVEYTKNDPDNELTRQYAKRKDESQNVGSHRRSTAPNVRELNSTPLSDLNAERSKTQSAFERANYSR